MAILENSSLLEVSLYVKGPDLNTHDASAVLGISPSKLTKRGDPKISGKNFPVYATTTWKLSRKAQSNDINAAIIELLAILDPTAHPARIQGAVDVFVDVFLASAVETGHLGSSIEWELSVEAIAALSRLALPLRFSVCNVEP